MSCVYCSMYFVSCPWYNINTMNNNTLGWGKIQGEGSEIWDTDPVFKNDKVELKDWLKLLFYPKKWFLYRYVYHSFRRASREARRNLSKRKNDGVQLFNVNQDKFFLKDSSTSTHPAGSLDVRNEFSILDVGCGTGATLIDFKRMFGRKVKVVGVDVVHLQVDLAKEKIKKNGVWVEVSHFDGVNLSFSDESFDAVYTSDVLGHVEHVEAWLSELNRVLKPGGVLAMFSESKLGKHAYIRNYLMKRGLNIDPHAEFHISLYSKTMLRELIERAGFEIKSMRTAFWASFLVHPDEFYNKLQQCYPERSEESLGFQDKERDSSLPPRFTQSPFRMTFVFLKLINKILYWIKKKMHPYSTALCELYGLAEMYLVGKYIEAQGYIILAKKK